VKHIGYPSIEQFQNVIRNVKHAAQYVGQAEDGSTIMNRNATMPTLKFRGTTKTHGTNSAVAFNLHTGDMWFQSRERIITLEQDNAGFAMFATARKDYFLELIRRIDDVSCTQKYIVIFGEFFGKGVQKGVAVSELPKTFCVFDIMVVDEDDSRTYFPRKLVEYVMEQRTENVVCIYDFPTWEMDIDFENPQLAQPKLIELTMAVEAECPVGKAFGVSSVGEGIVWKCIDENDDFHNSGFWFKVKGPRHQNRSSFNGIYLPPNIESSVMAFLNQHGKTEFDYKFVD